MRRLVTALVATAVAAVPGAAAADDLEVAGPLCSHTWLSSLDPGSPSQVSAIDGGPVAVTGAGPGATVELVCTLQVDAWNHDGPDAASARASGPGVAVVPPSVVTYDMRDDQWVVLCSEVRVTTASGVRALYWDDFADRWSDTPDVGCEDWTPDPFPPYDERLDLVVCPVIAALFPPEGDVTLPAVGKVWDCPPYDA